MTAAKDKPATPEPVAEPVRAGGYVLTPDGWVLAEDLPLPAPREAAK